MSTQLADDSSIPQWKRELILRRKCHLMIVGGGFGGNSDNNNGTTTTSTAAADSDVARVGDSVSLTPAAAAAGTPAAARTTAVGARPQSNVNGLCDRVRSDLVMVEERLCGAPPADADSDSSEELQYGPGIVNKLKCKYLSLALRESRKSRPSVLPLRRATSLDDLLDDDSNNGACTVHQQQHGGDAVKTYYPTAMMTMTSSSQRPNGRAVSRGNESLKRARSVETLLRCDRKPAAVSHSVPVVNPVADAGSRESFNDDVVIDERPVPAPRVPNNTNTTNSNNSNSNGVVLPSTLLLANKPPRRLAPLLADTERPPPDTVRSALRIFESTTRRGRPLKPVGDVAVKVATYKSILAAASATAAKKPLVMPKPTAHPPPTPTPPAVTAAAATESSKQTKPTGKAAPPQSPALAPVVFGFGSNLGLKPPTSPKHNHHHHHGKLICATPPVSPKKTPPSSAAKVTNDDNMDTTEPQPQQQQQQRVPSPRSLNAPSPPAVLLFRSPSPSSPVLLSPGSREGSPHPHHHHQQQQQQQLQQLQQGQVVAMPQSNFGAAATTNGGGTTGTRQIGVIRPLESPDTDGCKQRAVEFEKNMKNARENEAAALLSTTNNQLQQQQQQQGGAGGGSLWGGKRTWHQQTDNTVVFNFRNRKDVPDYIENDGLVMKARRERPKINDSGFILLEGVSQNNTSSSDWDNEDDLNGDDEEDIDGGASDGGALTFVTGGGVGGGGSGLVRCGIEFEGAAVIINGRSSLVGGGGGTRLQSRTGGKLHIHFDDASTSTYEYPSEASLLEDAAANVTSPTQQIAASGGGGPPSPPSVLGSATLSSYTPVKAGGLIDETFELGVTRSSPDGAPSSRDPSDAKKKKKSDNSGNSAGPAGRDLVPRNQQQQQQQMTNGVGSGDDESDGHRRHRDNHYLQHQDEDEDMLVNNRHGDEDDGQQYLRPASDDQTISWSQEKHATDLLF